MYRKQVRRRRAIFVGLIVLCLILLSSQFSEAESGPLHTFQRGVATVLAPIGAGAERALKPVRDMIDWFDETFQARGENQDLKAQVADLRSQVTALQKAAGENEQFEKLLHLDRTAELSSYKPVTSRVTARSPTVWFSTVQIDHGSSAGIKRNDAVVNGDGLVGRITDVTPNTSQVELITDHDNAVSAQVMPDGPTGIVEPEVGNPQDLLLDYIDGNETVEANQTLATAGWRNGPISSAYPPGIPIGRVTSTDSSDQQEFQRIHVEPFADLRELGYVQVLTGGDKRPGVPG